MTYAYANQIGCLIRNHFMLLYVCTLCCYVSVFILLYLFMCSVVSFVFYVLCSSPVIIDNKLLFYVNVNCFIVF